MKVLISGLENNAKKASTWSSDRDSGRHPFNIVLLKAMIYNAKFFKSGCFHFFKDHFLFSLPRLAGGLMDSLSICAFLSKIADWKASVAVSGVISISELSVSSTLLLLIPIFDYVKLFICKSWSNFDKHIHHWPETVLNLMELVLKY